jgi:hypothetical protein
MGKAFGIVMLVAGVFVALQIYLVGTENALGGAFAFLGDSEQEEVVRDRRTTPQRAGDAVRRANRQAEDRMARMLD